jgi:hypothetical protein
MARLTPDQQRTRERFESLIRVMAPGLNVVLAAGDRLSRIVQPEDAEYYPIRTTLTDGAPQADPDRGRPA